MRDLKRNQNKIYYTLYQESVPVYEVDENGDIIYVEIDGVKVPVETGETTSGYTEVREFDVNVSASKGETENNVFGKSLDYDKVLLTHDTMCEIDEFSRLWIDTKPIIGVGGEANSEPEYTVKRVAKSLNHIMYAVKKV